VRIFKDWQSPFFKVALQLGNAKEVPGSLHFLSARSIIQNPVAPVASEDRKAAISEG